jgi:tetratricopeptide (TPR) repeat protein
MDRSQAAAMGEICRQLDGLPLALELAAAQLKYESPQQLLVHLKRRFEVLVGGPRDLPTRQQTMRDCIAWSYDLLSPDEQDIFCRLAVFVGGCAVDTIEEIVRHDETPRVDLRTTLRSLVDQSVLVVDWTDREQARVTMLETIGRELGDQLLVLTVIPGLGQATLARGDIPAAIALFREGIDLCHEQGVTYMLGSLVYGLGMAFQLQGDLDLARAHLNESVTLFKAHGERVSIGSALRALGGIALTQRKFEDARMWFQDGLQAALAPACLEPPGVDTLRR